MSRGRPSRWGMAVVFGCGLWGAGLLGAGLWGAPSAAAETIESLYQSGLEDYYTGRFEDAAQKLERVAAVPLHHEELFYNLGCVYFRQSKLGPAIYNFERAIALDASFDDAQFNLRIARQAASRRVEDVLRGALADPWWSHVVKRLSLSGWWVTVLVLWWLVLALLFGLRYVGAGPTRAALIATTGLLAVLLVMSAMPLVVRIQLATTAPEAIVLPDELAVREGTDAKAREAFKLHAGLKLRVTSDASGWLRVRLANGLEGWVRRGHVGLL